MTSNDTVLALFSTPSTYEVVYRVPGGGDWSNMDLEVETVVVDHSARLVILGLR